MELSYEQVKRMRDAFGILLDGFNGLNERATEKGQGLAIQTEHGMIENECKGWLRVLDRLAQHAALDELTRMAQEDGLYYNR